jgi:HEAT repeat protein
MAKKNTTADPMAEMVSDMARAVRGASIYPHRHPSRDRLLARLHAKIFSLLADFGKIELAVSSRGLAFLDEPVVPRDGSAAFLAGELFQRQVASLSFVKGITLLDMEALTDLVRTAPEEVRAAGGASSFIISRGAQAVRADDVDYDGILKRREEKEGEGTSYGKEVDSPAGVPDEKGRIAAPIVFDDQGAPEVSPDQWLEQKLWELDSARDLSSYKGVLRDIFLNLRSTGALNLPQFTELVVRRLGRHLTENRPPEMIELLRAGVRELATSQVLDLLVSQSTQRNTRDRDAIGAVFTVVPEKAIPCLLLGLAGEKSSFGRKSLMTALASFGDQVRPFLDGWLADDRWYVVRNALGLLTETGSEKDSPEVQRFLAHENPRVRMEALRFLTRHPVAGAERHVLPLLRDPDPEVRSRAVFTLGARGGRKAYTHLAGLAKKPVWGEGDVALRETAVRSLARMGGDEAVDFLRSLLGRRGWADPEGHDRIEKAAAEALAEIGGERARSILRVKLHRMRGDALRVADDFLRRSGEG